jgi:hypothetical protein
MILYTKVYVTEFRTKVCEEGPEIFSEKVKNIYEFFHCICYVFAPLLNGWEMFIEMVFVFLSSHDQFILSSGLLSTGTERAALCSLLGLQNNSSETQTSTISPTTSYFQTVINLLGDSLKRVTNFIFLLTILTYSFL